MPDQQKYCPGCRETKPVILFQKNRSTEDGLQSQCARCQCATVQRYRDRERVAREWAKRKLLQTYRPELQELTRERMRQLADR